MGVLDNLGLFDLAAHVMPGVVVLSAVAWAYAAVAGGLPELPSDVVVATAGLVFAYVVGQLCQLAADTDAGRVLVKGGKWGARSHEDEYLHGGKLPKEFRARLHGAIEAHLDVKVPPPRAPGEVEEVNLREDCFRLCYASLLQEGNASRAQMFKAISGFHESMVPASAVAAVCGVIVLATQPLGPLAVLVTLVSVGAVLLFRNAYRQFDRRFVEAVYRGFYVVARKAAREGSESGGKCRAPPLP